MRCEPEAIPGWACASPATCSGAAHRRPAPPSRASGHCRASWTCARCCWRSPGAVTRSCFPRRRPAASGCASAAGQPGVALLPGRWGTTHPDGPEAEPDFLLVPLLAWDGAGRRLGYGGGYYDRTLAALPGRFRLGCAFACQRVDEVPAGPHDPLLDAVATEEGVCAFSS